MNSAADQTGSRGENGGAILCYTSKLSLLTNKPSLFDEEIIYLLIESFFLMLSSSQNQESMSFKYWF